MCLEKRVTVSASEKQGNFDGSSDICLGLGNEENLLAGEKSEIGEGK